MRHTLGVLTFAATAWTQSTTLTHASEIGSDVVNIATLTYTVGDTTASITTNSAVFTIQAPPTPAPVIEFFRHSPSASNARSITIHGSKYSPSGDIEGPFVPVGQALTTGGQIIDTTEPLLLAPATTFLTGELMFVQVTDIAGNEDPDEIETVSITITSDSGDVVVIQLYESGKNSGQFWAYIPTTDNAIIANDNQLTTANETELTAAYIDAFTQTDVVVDTAFINSNCFVFDSVTGERIDGASISLINADTGETAIVYGVDEFSAFPSQIMSGGDVTDNSGLVYDPEVGGFQFPFIEPGNYYVKVDAPDGYNFASILPIEQVAANNSQFNIENASYGEVFSVTEPGPIHFDIPLDPQTDFTLTKAADRNYADVGDFINYSLTIQNAGTRAAPVKLFDTLPLGFRYVPGTTRLEKTPSSEPTVSDDAALLTFPMGVLAPGETITLDYALEVGPGAPMGDAINRAIVQDVNGAPLSNVARAAIKLREDLLRSRSTVVGRISEQSCDGEQEWARDIERGIGVEGVRLYLETGAYAVSDSDGLFHFEGVTKGTHVIQLDEETLPKGYTPMVCEENTRYAGSATSKFVDIQGGGIWRANFYLKQTGEKEQAVEAEEFNDTIEYKNYDNSWLETQNAAPEWVYPDTTRTPSSPAINIGIKHGPKQRVDLMLNDKPVSKLNLAARDQNKLRTVMISRWRGVDLLEGNNNITAIVKNSDGSVAKVLNKRVAFVKTIARAIPVPDQSTLIANGRDVPVVAIRLEDEAGRPVHKGRIARVDIESPYRLYDETGERTLQSRQDDLIAPLSARREAFVGADGILKVRLEPTLQTGKVTVIVTLDNGRKVPVYMYLEPEKRDWILVGLAEGSAALQSVKGNSVAMGGGGEGDDDVITDGRVAFFAKGLIKGDWLMTLAVDTNMRRFGNDQNFAEEIDPNAYYTLYGDRSYQDFEGVSRYPVFVKLEKRTAYAMFGDFDTDIPEGRLTAYNRRLSGVKAEYLAENFQVLGFAAETNQGFVKDELPADGTSGSYQLSNGRILAQSEEIVIETRDRNRPDIILDRKVMVRYLDYTLDYLTGELIFRLPVDATDFNFNPNVIIADYETQNEAEKNITAGGRVQAQLADGRVRMGSTFVHEEGALGQAQSEQNMVGVDIVADISDNTEVRAEYAITDSINPDLGTSSAMLAEVIHTTERVSAEAYFREEDEGFGLGQRNSTTNRIRRFGTSADIRVSEFEDEKTGRRGTRTISGQAYREENLNTGDTRDAGEITATHNGERLSVEAGLRAANDRFIDREDRTSLLAVSRASLSLPDHGVTFQAAHEQPLGGKDAVSNAPQRTTLGVDKTLGSKATVSLRHEFLNGATSKTQNTILGVSASPWSGTTINANSDLLTNDLGRRLGATVGLDQQIQINDKWSASAGARRRNVLDQSGDFIEVAPDAAISPVEVNEDFISAYGGIAYRDDVMSASVRVEGRDSSAGDTLIATGSVTRELSETLSLAGAVRGFKTKQAGESESANRTEARLGAAWRPRGEDLIVFNRFDVVSDKKETGERETKLVNNTAINTMISDQWQLTANYGVKHVKAEIAGQSLKSWNHLIGAETRFDVSEKIDIGLRGQMLRSTTLDTTEYSWGPSIGISLVKNVWVSAGYNVEGFRDDDFEATEYSRKGAYLQMRIKFDQNTARGLLRRISPSANTSEAGARHSSFANP